MKRLIKYKNIQELNDKEAKSVNGGGPILEGAAWLLGVFTGTVDQTYHESMDAVNSPITGPGGNKYM